MPQDLIAYDWTTWQPGVQATLVFLFRDDEVLLIEKKTGLGAGKVNAPGGKLEFGESAQECALRELHEEVGLRAHSLTKVAELRFLMSDHADIFCTVFFGHRFWGDLTETHEAAPFWVPTAEIPYDRMWADDRIWLPRALNGERILGSFQFEGDTMLAQWIQPLL